MEPVQAAGLLTVGGGSDGVSGFGRALIDQLDDDDLARLADRLADRLGSDRGGWLDARAAATYAGCTVPALRYAMSRGELEFEQSCPGGKVYLQRSAIDRWRGGG